VRCPEEETMTATYPLSLGVCLSVGIPFPRSMFPLHPFSFLSTASVGLRVRGDLASGSYRYTMVVCMACGTDCATAAADDGAAATAGGGAIVVAPARY